MPKKGVRVVITGQPRPTIDVDAMTQIIIALGRQFAQAAEQQVQVASEAGSHP